MLYVSLLGVQLVYEPLFLVEDILMHTKVVPMNYFKS